MLYKYIDPCSLGQQCSYHGNLGSFADIPHIQLVGRRADGVFLDARGSAIPTGVAPQHCGTGQFTFTWLKGMDYKADASKMATRIELKACIWQENER